MRAASAVCVMVLAGGFLGCSGDSSRPSLSPVAGLVKYNGQPIADAAVVFTSTDSTRSASGQTNTQGEYKLTTFDTDDGAVLGDHVVTISKVVAIEGKSTKEMNKDDLAKMTNPTVDYGKLMKDQLPEKYADPKKSGLKRTVVKGEPNAFNFDLKD